MASIISAGTTSGTALNMAGDTSGELQIATNGSTTAVTIDTSQNVGIGTTSPAAKLDIGSGNLNFSSTAQRITGDFSNATFSNRVMFQTSTTNGNTAIGAIPNGTATTTFLNLFNNSDPTNSALCQIVSSSTTTSIRSAIAGTGTYLPMTFFTGGSERMRITSDGILCVNTTASDGQITVAADGNTRNMIRVVNTNTGSADQAIIGFVRNATYTGGINNTGTNTSYNTSSDYRLKENIAPMTGALNRVAQLKPCTYTWKIDGSNGQGFIAHELQEVVPDCVSGEKDAVETYTGEDGIEQTRPAYQGVDTSFLVATLTAAIQEQQTIINDLKARITALEGAA
jgi:hypothetical protein